MRALKSTKEGVNMFYAIFFTLAVLAILAMYFTKAYKSENPVVDKVLKIVCVVWMALYFLNLFLPDGFVLRTYDDISIYQTGKGIPYALFRWVREVSFIILPIAIFFKKPLFKKFVAFAVLPIALLNVILYFVSIKYYTSPMGAGIMPLRFFNEETKAFFINKTFRGIYFGVVSFLELMLASFITLRTGKDLKISKDWKSILLAIAAFVLIFVSVIPIYVPQYLSKGYSNVGAGNFDNFKMATPFHYIWIVGVVIEGVLLTLYFKKKSYQDRYIVAVVLALSLVLQYNTMFTCVGEITAHRYPFQLCNMAPLFILLMLVFRSEKIYHFAIVINSVGAIIAMALCDTTPYGVTYVMNIHYIAEHTNVILVPILCATLGLFAPLKIKDVKHFIAGFTMYFAFVFILGGIFTGLKETIADPNLAGYWDCNYLYMFNKGDSVKIIGFAGPLFDAKITLFNFFTISLVQLVIYVVFLAICTGAFFLIKLLLGKNKNWEEPLKNELAQ